MDSSRHPWTARPVVAPSAPVSHHPIEQRPLETNVMPDFFALDPLVPQNLFPLGKKLTIQHGVTDEAGTLVRVRGHDAEIKHNTVKSQGGGDLRNQT